MMGTLKGEEDGASPVITSTSYAPLFREYNTLDLLFGFLDVFLGFLVIFVGF